jgi:hypothetical protein
MALPLSLAVCDYDRYCAVASRDRSERKSSPKIPGMTCSNVLRGLILREDWITAPLARGGPLVRLIACYLQKNNKRSGLESGALTAEDGAAFAINPAFPSKDDRRACEENVPPRSSPRKR